VSEYTGPLPSTTIGNSSQDEENFGPLDPEDDSWIADFCDGDEDDDDDSAWSDDEEEVYDTPDATAQAIDEAVLREDLESLLQQYTWEEILAMINKLSSKA
jgi:hypothetical protein